MYVTGPHISIIRPRSLCSGQMALYKTSYIIRVCMWLCALCCSGAVCGCVMGGACKLQHVCQSCCMLDCYDVPKHNLDTVYIVANNLYIYLTTVTLHVHTVTLFDLLFLFAERSRF